MNAVDVDVSATIHSCFTHLQFRAVAHGKLVGVLHTTSTLPVRYCISLFDPNNRWAFVRTNTFVGNMKQHHVSSAPKSILKFFKVVSYSGGSQDFSERYVINHLFDGSGAFHCSGPGSF